MNMMERIREIARNAAAADIFSHMASEEGSKKLYEQLRSLPDDALDTMAKLSGVPENQFHIHRSMARGEPNEFIEELSKIDELLKTGDIILMAGTSDGSKKLIQAQRLLYSKAKSSHVALIHADFICIDAMPESGVTNRVISDVLMNVEIDWRVIRHKKMQPESRERIARACVFYLYQPYKIRPSKKALAEYSYCSELARKVYDNTGLGKTSISSRAIISPADFDKLVDEHPQWIDVTECVRPAINFCSKYPELVKVSAKLFIDGLKLNESRFSERTALLERVAADLVAGKISREKASKIKKSIKDIEQNLNHSFWNVRR